MRPEIAAFTGPARNRNDAIGNTDLKININ
jgi:hypothetical protein